MTPEEVIDLLSLISARDNRTVGQATVAAWLDDVGDLPFEDAREAIGRHFRTSTDWLMPGHIRQHVKTIREERIGPAGPGLGPTPPPADPDDTAAYLAALRAQQAQVASGQLPREAPALPAGKDRAAYDTPAVRNLRARFEAAQEAARRSKAEEAAAEKTALATYRDAVRVLCDLDLPERVAAVVEQARDELLSDEQAALGFPLLAETPGVTDEHKIAVHAAQLAQRHEGEAS